MFSVLSLSLSFRLFFYDLLVRIARDRLTQTLRDGLRSGHLVIHENDSRMDFGVANPSDVPDAEITVNSDMFWVRIYLWLDLGFAEAYMNSDFSSKDVKAILKLWIKNRDTLGGLSSIFHRIFVLASSTFIYFLGQTLSNSKKSAEIGYDSSNEFFQAFLSPDMTYSSAEWSDESGGVRGDIEPGSCETDLEVAQRTKIATLLRKAQVGPGSRLLEFGSGWGALAIQAAKLGCFVDSVTLSIRQKELADQRIVAAGVQDKVRVHLMDYRNLPSDFEHAFDAFIAVEMVEAVGLKHLPGFFKILDWALKPNRATALITISTQPEFRYTAFQPTDYARRYQWPNSFCPSPTSFVRIPQSATPGKFVLRGIDDNSIHYPRTLREWNLRLQRNWNEKLVSQLVKAVPHLSDGDNLEFFKRKFEYMCIYAEVGYTEGYTSLQCFHFTRPGNIAVVCD